MIWHPIRQKAPKMTTQLRAVRLACALAVLSIAAFAFGQDSSSAAPVRQKPKLDLQASAEAPAEGYVAPYMRPMQSRPKTERVLDAKFVGVSAIAMALTIADIENTQRCLAKNTCTELNPLMPKSRAGMYAVNIPLNAGLMYLSYRLKARGNRAWWIAPLAISGAHGVGVGFVF